MKTIYALLDPDTRRIRYVGATGDPVRRLRNHWSSRLPGRTGRVAEWMRTLSSKPELHVLQEVKDEVVDEAEKYWINLLTQVPSVDLLNVSDMSHGYPSGYRTRSAEFRTKMRKGSKRTYEWNADRTGHRGDIRNRLSVDEINAIKNSTATVKQIASQYGISTTSVYRIKSGNIAS